MAKPYSQDLRDRVIEAVERGKRAAERRVVIRDQRIRGHQVAECLERQGSREPVGHGGHRASKLMPHRDFLEAARREIGHHASGSGRSPVGRARGSSRHLDDEPLLPQDRGDG